QHELAVIMNFFRLEPQRERLLARKHRLQDHHQTHGRQALAHDDNESEDGREPTGIEGHDPIDGGEANGEGVENQSGRSQPAETRTQVLYRGSILLIRPADKRPGHQDPDDEINDRTTDHTIQEQELPMAPALHVRTTQVPKMSVAW